jgi:hypothetical protein
MQSGQTTTTTPKKRRCPPDDAQVCGRAGWLAVNQPSYRAEGSSCPRGELAGACRDRDPFACAILTADPTHITDTHTHPGRLVLPVMCPPCALAITGHGEVQGAPSVPYIFATRNQMPSPSDHVLESFHGDPLTAAVPYMSLSRPSFSSLPSPLR